MSCRSTPLSSAMVSFANALHPDLSDSQIQSLFHSLKREYGTGESIDRSLEPSLDAIKSRVRNSDITERQKDSILARIYQAEMSEQDSDMLYASNRIVERAGVAEYQINKITAAASQDLNVPAYLVKQKLKRWRELPEGEYEDMGEEVPNAYRYDLVAGVPTDDKTGRALRKLGYTQFLEQPYPVFVYGTLRKGQGNSVLFGNDYYQIAPAAVSGVGVYGAHRSFPYAKENQNAAAFGDVFWIDETEAGGDVRYSLDSLEGFDSDHPSYSHYKRVLREATYIDQTGNQKTTPVWIYLASGRYNTQLREEELISDGDWVTARNRYRESPLGKQERRHLGY